ncbi:MAG: GAF domain-containing protein, partial [Planctomycetaceae bacterium]|nr:GAF domain-containing protein [Planctomycetaceae bacterium]
SGKVQALEEKYSQLLAKRPAPSEIPDSHTTTPLPLTGSRSADALDFATVMKASHAISGEIVLDSLLSKMMDIVMENVGAQKGYLILDKSGQWVIEAASAIEASDVNMLHSLSIEQSDCVSARIIRYVAHTQERIVLHDATHEGSFTSDPHIVTRQPKSVLCLPLLHRGHLSGMLYLENNLTIGAFTPKRLEVLDILSSQMAISLENALLYNNLEHKVKERTIALEQEIAEHKQTEEELRQYREHLEELVKARTAELQQANERLQQEVSERKRAEQTVR